MTEGKGSESLGNSQRVTPEQHYDRQAADDSITSKSGSLEQACEMAPVHKVSIPRRVAVAREFEDAVKEALFPDDPLRQFKNQPARRKFSLGLTYVFPVFEWGKGYNLQALKGDIIAGLTIGSLCIPQDIGYSKLANLPAKYGLYTSFVSPLVYSIFGSSRHIAIGPVAVVSILMGTMLNDALGAQNNCDTSAASPSKSCIGVQDSYLSLAFTATFFAGLFQFALGLLRLGFTIDFLSHAAIVGFMAGAAVTIGLQQLKGLLGISTAHFTKKTDLVSVMDSVWHHTNEWNWETILIGLFFLAFLLIAKFIAKKRPRLFWVAAVAPLISVILSTAFVKVTRVDKHGVAIVKKISTGVNPSSVGQLHFQGHYVGQAAKIGFIAGLIALTEGIAIGRTFASLKDYKVDGNKEMLAFGIMNMIGSCTSCYTATGSFSRSAVNYNSGCQTTISNVVMSLMVLIVLAALTPLFKYTPNCILASIIINAVISLIDIKAAILIWKIDKLDFLACLGAFLGVLFVSVEIGLLIAVGLSIAKILLHVTRPRTSLLGNIPGTNIYQNVHQYADANRVPGLLLVQIDSAIYFSNSNYIRERLLRWVDDEEEVAKSNGVRLRFVIVEMSPVTNIDTTGIHSFVELYTTLQKRQLQLAIANPGSGVIQKLDEAKFVELVGQEWFFLTVGEAVQVCSRLVRMEI
eukprot:c22261_g1_i1 orf=235-2301(+)